MTWLDVVSVIMLTALALVVIAYAYRWWRISHYNEEGAPGGSMGDQIIGPRDDTADKPL